VTSKKTNGSPNEDTQQSTNIRTPNEAQEGDEENVDSLPRTGEAIVNVFKMFEWVMKEGWLRIPRKLSKKDAIEKACSSNTANEVSKREIFKLFLQSPACIKTDISLKLP
jgi:hypothetical protein